MGFSGIQNFPTVGLIDGVLRANLEETGMSYGQEVDLIGAGPLEGHADHALCVQRRRSRSHGEGGGRHHRLPSWASPPAAPSARKTALKLADCPALVDEWSEAALKVNKNAIVLVHGGPVSMPDDAEFILQNTKNCHGFYGASSMERLPTEVALTEQTRKFKAITFG